MIKYLFTPILVLAQGSINYLSILIFYNILYHVGPLMYVLHFLVRQQQQFGKKKPSVNSGKGLKWPAFLSFSEQQMRKIMDGRIAKGITLFLYHGVVVAFVF